MISFPGIRKFEPTQYFIIAEDIKSSNCEDVQRNPGIVCRRDIISIFILY